MHDQPTPPNLTPRKILRPRRLALLASAAGLSLAVLAAGPGGYLPLNLPEWIAPAHAAEAIRAPGGFADLVGKVKPAVISVRVKIDEDGGNAAVIQRDSEQNSDQSRFAVRSVLLPAIRLPRSNEMPHSSGDHRRRFGLLHLAGRLCGDQQSRGRPRQIGAGHDRRRHDLHGQGGRHRPEDRPGADQGRRQEGLLLREIRRPAAAHR